MWRGRTWGLVSWVTALSMLVPGIAGAASESEVVLAENPDVRVIQKGDWVIWDFTEELPNPETVTVKGSLLPSGECYYARSVTSDGSTIPGYFRIYREVAHNASDCILRLEAANLPLRRLGEFDGSEPDSVSVSESFLVNSPIEASMTGGGEQFAATSTTSTAWFKSVYEDPIEIDVNSVKVNLQWTWNGSCVTSSTNHSAVWYWFEGTGWFLKSKSGSGGRTCSSAYTKATGEFWNWTWGDDSLLTWTKHTDTKISGLANGSITVSWNLTKGGEDSGLLHTDFVCSWTSC
ncbi:MAG: hypothetical protein KatS3mg011_0723 [Acidimicrobiia bacterium]|nr:MAG: hypothetical protein KatS3mg011_0723 [Acidimicrobiia bacterium]